MSDRLDNAIVGELRNNHYENDIHYTLQMCQWLLKAIGLWPLIYSYTSKLEQLVSIFLMTVCLFSMLFIILPSGHHAFFVDKRIETKLQMFGPVGFCLSSAIKYCYIGLKGPYLERCMQHVRKDWKMVQDPNHRAIMLKYVTISRKLITVCAVFLYTGGMSFHTVMQLLSTERNKENITLKPLTYAGYDSFLDVQSSPAYEIVFFLHCFAGMVMYSVATAAYSFAAIFVTHSCGQIEIQLSKLQNLVKKKEEGKKNGSDSIVTIVRDHVEILGFSNNIEEALREICFMEIIESTLNMCLLEYYFITEWQNSDTIAMLTLFTLLISFTFNIFIFCYIGETLTEQCSQIGTISYEINWYDLPAKEAYDLILLISVSQNPPKLTAGKMVDLSLNTFSSVVKTSVAYLNLIRTVAVCLSLHSDTVCVLHIVLEQKDQLLRLKLSGLTSFSFISLMKYWVLTMRKPKIEHCIKQVYSDWKQVEDQKDREHMLKYGKIGRNLTMCSVIFMYSGGIIYHTIMQYDMGSYVDEYNRTIKLLVYPTRDNWCLWTGCTFLNDLVDGKFSKGNSNSYIRLTKFIKRHIRILRFSEMVGTVLQEVCFLEFIGTTFVICLLEYYCLTDWEQNNIIGLSTYTLLLISLTFNMFLLCFIGNLLIEKSSIVGEFCYMTDWYNLSTQMTKGLTLIIALSHIPAKISAGRIIYLSLPTFVDVLKTSFAYLNFLRKAVV
ncbi:PREDICTED: odorant receptor 4-like [Eufriesea mexicana]|uniref:odorant receptor 4-like n=1 Tax=Eufriesea mexicana TaxID=516756 RepID=UPI00083C7F16|nr:PREDICTED: odorant receptor 4-like [Eufriesea mexicana]